MPFGMVGRLGPGMRQVVGFGGRSTGRGNFWDEYGAPHCNRLRRSCAKVHELSELRFGVVRVCHRLRHWCITRGYTALSPNYFGKILLMVL